MKNGDIQSFVTMLSILYAGCHAAPGNVKIVLFWESMCGSAECSPYTCNCIAPNFFLS